MVILHDSGLYRNLRCAKAGTWETGFYITTWPGFLAISGDMGCYVFTRLTDMFEFFRGDRVNPSYWAEKIEASDRCSGLREFDKDEARRWVAEQVKEAKENGFTDLDDLDDDLDAINYEDGPIRFHDSLPGHGIFRDAWEHNFERYTFRFLWACHAIVWAIKRYDLAKKAAEVVVR
jgi:hypothetical protein